MKRVVKLFFTLILVASTFSFLPASAADTPTSETTEKTETPAETTETPETPTEPETTTEKPGEAWSGIIAEPANENIKEPVTPAPAPAPTPVETPAPTNTPTPASTRVVATTPVETSAETPVEIVEETTEEAAEESAVEDSATKESEIFVPETARAARSTYVAKNRKIFLMALITTAIAFFTFVSIMAGIEAFNLSRTQKSQKTKNSKKSHKSSQKHSKKTAKKHVKKHVKKAVKHTKKFRLTREKPAKDTNPLLLPPVH